MRSPVVSGVLVLILVGALGAGCTSKRSDPPAGSAEVPQPTISERGDAIEVAVAPTGPLNVAVPGVGHITGALGAFATAGKLRISSITSNQPANDLVVTSSIGLDVRMDGTSLSKPLTVAFDDPAARHMVPSGAVPVVLHQPGSGGWEVKPLAMTKDGVPLLQTTEFSPNLLGWIPIPDWVRGIGDSIADAVTQHTDPRPCPRSTPPRWSSVDKGTTLVHLCSITNTDSAGVPRAELQVQSNRRFVTWVSVPTGADYVWVDGQPGPVHAMLSRVLRHGEDQVLMEGNGLLTAGYRQPADNQTKQFNAYIDGYSAALSVALNLIGISFKDGVYGAIVILRDCTKELLPRPTFDGAKKYIVCLVEGALSNLANPDKAYAAAMDLYGESGYARSAEKTITKSIERLKFLGRLLRVIGIAGVITATFPQLPDLFSDWGTDHPGRFTLKLTAKPATPVTPTTKPSTGPTGPGGGGNPPPTNPKIELSQGGSAPAGYWYNMALSGFTPGSSVTVTCRDSKDPGGFWNQTFTIGGDGRAGDSTLCYSADGPDHWVTGGGTESNHVGWGSAPPPPPPPPASPKIELSRGGAAPAGYWYNMALSGFTPGSSVTVTCRDSKDPGGFWNQTFTIGGDGRAGDSTLCYSADGPDHWVTGGGTESNHVGW